MSKKFHRRNQKYPRPKIDRITVRSIGDFPENKENLIGEKNEEIPTLRDILNDYLESTSVHGLQYFGKTDIKVGTAGKILWACIIVICFVCLTLMVMQFLRRYNENPTNTYIKTFEAPIHRAPFPAVTVCPIAPISLKKRINILENSFVPQNMSRDFLLNLLKYGHHMTNPYAGNNLEQFIQLKVFLEINKWKVTDFLKILTPCEEMFQFCWWSSDPLDCIKWMKVTHTSFGLCCSFNYLLEEYVGMHTKGQSAPKTLASATFGRWSGLRLEISNDVLTTQNNEHDFMRLTYSNNIMILIHHPLDFPGFMANTYIVRGDDELEIAINPTVIIKPPGLLHRNKEDKIVPVCISDEQNDLDYFPFYRNANCYVNCRMKLILEICGCLPYIYGPFSSAFDIPHCNLDGLECINEYLYTLATMKDVSSKNDSCICNNPCKDVTYDGLPNIISLMETGNSTYMRKKGTAIVKVYMASQMFQILETLPAADKTYLLASIGGIFSLFLGCSFLSLVEIVYFAYLCCRSVYLRRKMKSQEVQIFHEANRHRYAF